MRIAQAVALFAPDFNGGATLVCRRLGDALAARGHTVDVFSGRATPDEPTGAIARGRLGALSTWRVNVGGAFDPESEEGYLHPHATTAFVRLLDEAKPDVVHLHSLQGLGVGLVGAARERDVPVVLTMHDWWWLCPCLFRLSPSGTICTSPVEPGACWGRPFERRRRVLAEALAHVDRVLVPSAFLREDLIANGFDGTRIEVQENGVPPPAVLSASLPESDAPDGPLRIAYVGGAGNGAKGLTVLLEAAALLGEAPFRLLCHAVAPAEADPWVARLGARLECRSVFAPEDVDRVMAEADVVVIPSLMRESFSLVAREALSRGRPVVTSDCGGPEEVVRDGVNGRIVRSGSAEALAAALSALISDRTELERLRPSPPPRFRTPEEHAVAAEGVYREVLRATSSRAASPQSNVASVSPVAPTARAQARPAAARASLAGRSLLILTGTDGAPLRYRVWHLVERLAIAGVRCEVLYHSDASVLGAAARADAVLLFRAPYSVMVAAVVADARRRGRPVVFAVDDLVFHPELAADAPALADPTGTRAAGFRESVLAYSRSAQVADAFVGSTPELVAAAADLGLPGLVERNRLGSPWLARSAGVDRAARDRRFVRLGYFSGTDTHDADLATIAVPLARVLLRFPNARLVLAGPLRVPSELASLAARIERRPFVPWSDLPASLASLDVNLVPLDLSRRFNLAKSEVKYLEASTLGIPTVGSPGPALRAASGEGATALLAESFVEWESSLARLVESHETAERLGEDARRDVMRRYAPSAGADDLHEWLADLLARRSEGEARAVSRASPIVMEAGGGSAVALEPPAAAYDAHHLDAESGEALRPGEEVEQRFTCREDGLFRVDVRVGTYARKNRHAVVFDVRDEHGTALGRRVVPAEHMVDRSFVAVPLDEPLRDSAGRTIRVTAAAPEAAPGNEVLLWRAPSQRGGLRIGGRPCDGFELSYRSFSGAPS